MKFVAVEDIAAPIDHVWAQVADVDRFEARMARRVGRIDRRPPGPAGPGTTWSGATEVMGKVRDVVVAMDRMTPPQEIALSARTEGMVVEILVQLAAQSPRLTRLTVTTDAKARSLTARVMLQSAKLARKTLARRYKGRVAEFANTVEADFEPRA
ncbi:MAG: SRPBCC family protein [Pseudomonadota bacterium]